MKIATWNVNSIRTRLDRVIDWLQTSAVDVLCLQETKVVDDDFPRSRFEELGYELAISGQKAYNGVAIASRLPVTDVTKGFAPVLGAEVVGELDRQKRAISATIADLRIVNLYVPNGATLGSDKYEYKLHWLSTLQQYLQVLLDDPKHRLAEQPDQPSILICGDFNIALEDRDIHDPEGKETHIMASPTERAALQQAVLDLGFADAFRKFTSEPGHFSWWDYRAASFRRNRGWRIDHHYLTPALYERAVACTIDIEPRKQEKPSDHTPVIVEID